MANNVRLVRAEFETAVKYLTKGGFVNSFPITFKYSKEEYIVVQVGFKIIEPTEYVVEMVQGIPTVKFTTDLPVGVYVTLRSRSDSTGVPHTYHYTGNVKGQSEFNQKTMDENFEYLDRIVEEVNDSAALTMDSLAGFEVTFEEVLVNSAEAIRTANAASSTANTALGIANSANTTANSASNTANEAVSTANEANVTAGEAKATSDSADTKATEALTTSNIAEGNASNALTLATQADATSDNALTTATSAKVIAEGISGIAQEALDTANEADSNASIAKDVAEGIEAKADQAIDTANTASNVATDAKETAEGIAGVANDALDTAVNANEKAQEALDKGGITESELISKSVGAGKWMRDGAYGLGSAVAGGSAVPQGTIPRGLYFNSNNTAVPTPSGSFANVMIGGEGGTAGGMLFLGRDGSLQVKPKVGGYWGDWIEAWTEVNTRTDKNNVLHRGTGTPINTLNVSDMAQDVVDRDDMAVTSGAVYRALDNKRDLDDNVFDGHMSIKSDGTVRGRMTYDNDGLQFEQVQEDGTQQTFTFPRYGESGELTVKKNLDYVYFTEVTANNTKPVYIPKGELWEVESAPPYNVFGGGVIKFKVGLDYYSYVTDLTPNPVPAKILTYGTGTKELTVNMYVGSESGGLRNKDNSMVTAIGGRALSEAVDGVTRVTAVGSHALRRGKDVFSVLAVGASAMENGSWFRRFTAVGDNAAQFAGDNEPKKHHHEFFIDGDVYGLEARNSNFRNLVGSVDQPLRLPSSSDDARSGVAVGRNALLHVVKSADDVAVGYNAMAHSYDTSRNTAVGESALRDGVIADRNTAIGSCAMMQNQEGYANTAVGAGSLQLGIKTHSNTAVGFNSANSLDGVSRQNTVVGALALESSKHAVNTVAVGNASLKNATTSQSVAVGAGAGGEALETANNSTLVGFSAGSKTLGGSPVVTLTNSTAIGFDAPLNGDNQVQLGNSDTTTYVYGTVQNRSDARDKADIKELDLGLDFVMKLKPSEYRWNYREWEGKKTGKRKHAGFIAQEVQEVIDSNEYAFVQDHSVNGGSDVLSIGYDEFIPVLAKAIQEQQKLIEDLKEEVRKLKEV